MSITTSLTRAWLTRSLQPFRFQREYDEQLPFEPCENLGLYVHIPFCRSICNFCPYCKVLYSKESSARYFHALLQEIESVGKQQAGKKEVTSLYFGGGTPALAGSHIGEMVDTIRRYFRITEGIGVELHPDDVSTPILQMLKAAGVTKISIGVQSFHEKYQKLLTRPTPDPSILARALSRTPFETVSIDLIFALPGQTFDELREDIDTAFACGANHVAIYPFIDFTFTASPVKAMNPREKRKLLDAITHYCLQKGYTRTSIWTFSNGEHQYSSMTRDNFLGFGCSATTLLEKQFKINTFSIEDYCERIERGTLPTSLTLRFTPRQRMVYYLFWTAYSTEVKSEDFQRFFGVPLQKMYGLEFGAAKLLGMVTEDHGNYYMTPKGAFYYHYYENFYTLAYIDKMWGILRKEAFPDFIEL